MTGTYTSETTWNGATGSFSVTRNFHDVTTGNNLTLGPVSYAYHAGPGWDPVTGWGSPNAQVLIPLLARVTSRS